MANHFKRPDVCQWLCAKLRGLAPLVLAFLQVLQVIVAFIPGHVFVIAGGYIYGLPWGLLFNIFCVVSASQLGFLLARWAGRPIVHQLAASETIEKWETIAEQQGFMFFTIAFVLPVFPTDIMNFVAGVDRHFPHASFWQPIF